MCAAVIEWAALALLVCVLFAEVGQIHLEIRELKNILDKKETQFDVTVKEFNLTLSELEEKYPSGEIDLLEGTVSY